MVTFQRLKHVALNALYLVVLTVCLRNICMIAQQNVSSQKRSCRCTVL